MKSWVFIAAAGLMATVLGQEMLPPPEFVEVSPDEEMAVLPEAMPKMPEQVDDSRQDDVIIERVKGVVLVGGRDDLLRASELDDIEGLQTRGLFIPGGEKKLGKKLEPIYYNQPLTRRTLTDLKVAISKYFKDQHFPLVVVEVPEQDITSGVIQLVVIEGRLGELKIEGNEYTSSKRLENYMRLKPNQEIDENVLIQDLQFINRNPFRRADVIYAPGEEVGTTNVTLKLKERRPLRFYFGAENSGVATTSRERWLTGFNWGNAFWLDHVLAYQFTSSYDVKEFHAHTAQYIAPLPWHHVLNIYGGYARVDPNLPDQTETIFVTGNVGRSYQVSARYSIPLPGNRYLLHDFTFGYDWKRTNNNITFSLQQLNFGDNVNISQFVVGYTGNYERNKYRLDFDTDLVWSPGKMMSDQSQEDYESLRPGADNDWVYWRGSFVYLQRLPYAFSLSLMARGQYTYQNLLPSEQFVLGGYDTVRGYDQRQVNTDNGVLLSGELRSPAFNVLKYIKRTKAQDAMQFLIFCDYGYGRDHDGIPGIPKNEWLMGVGPGFRYTVDPYLTARVDIGWKIHNEAEFRGGGSEVHFSVVASY